ncbi:hypothetical protein Baya_8690 [Bagarius yarrelli]|uniref:Uncharacterized protein n=1 Tax=Bagarius yarrelli TaxID=175774 RepID=A0A556U7U1_BAGYA|nr:hypothetical protein Baya_8690 [Bagarius yarrelli]
MLIILSPVTMETCPRCPRSFVIFLAQLIMCAYQLMCICLHAVTPSSGIAESPTCTRLLQHLACTSGYNQTCATNPCQFSDTITLTIPPQV